MYQGYASQYGHGLGNVLCALIRSAMHLVGKVAKAAGTKLLETGLNYVSNNPWKRKAMSVPALGRKHQKTRQVKRINSHQKTRWIKQTTSHPTRINSHQKTRWIKQTTSHPTRMHKRKATPGKPVSQRQKGPWDIFTPWIAIPVNALRWSWTYSLSHLPTLVWKKESVIECLPISTLGDGPFAFQINSDEEYIDLDWTVLYVKAKQKSW